MVFLQSILPSVSTYSWIAVAFDFCIVYAIIYRLLIWINDTHIESLVRGLLVILVVYVSSQILGLATLNWLLEKFATILVVLVIVLFQPEIRRFLERIGSGKLFSPFVVEGSAHGISVIHHILRAVQILSKEKVGAIIVIEAGTNLSDYIRSGIAINATITAELLASLFWSKSPTHDGAVIIRETELAAAGCLLPLSESTIQDRRLGTRHRAAIGMSEVSDAVVIIVSEETGTISIAENGNLTRYLTKEALEARLFSLYREDTSDASSFWNIASWIGKK
ncbi:TIGR00159 family protein [bacterium]|nr:TIGR00159 family protein [bacterium]